MNAIRLQDDDGTEELAYEDVPRPTPRTGEVLVRVRAAGVNPLDWLICNGTITALRDEPCPWTPGWDVSGVVEAVGGGATGVEPGDAVYGMARLPGGGGTFAEYATMSVEAVVPKPASLSHVEAAAVPMAGQTAVHALYEAGGLTPGQRVLVHAAAGGVGHMAVRFAANTGAHVVGTASGYNEKYLRGLGVNEVIDYREERFEDSSTRSTSSSTPSAGTSSSGRSRSSAPGASSSRSPNGRPRRSSRGSETTTTSTSASSTSCWIRTR